MQSCRTCKYAEWRRAKNNHRLFQYAGNCTFELEIPVIPDAYLSYEGRHPMEVYGKRVIWQAGGKTCPCYEVE